MREFFKKFHKLGLFHDQTGRPGFFRPDALIDILNEGTIPKLNGRIYPGGGIAHLFQCARC